MALNFPNSPTNGQLYTDSASGNRWVWDSGNTCWVSTSTFTQTITVASTAPGSPVAGQLWWNKDYGRLLVYYTDDNTSQWVDASPSDYTSQLAYNQANAAFGVANTAFNAANNVNLSAPFNVANASYNTTNTSFGVTNSAFGRANTAYSSANNASKSWMNYSGSGTTYYTFTTPYIRASYNMSSVTRNTTGDITVNIGTAFQDADYCISAGSSGMTGYSMTFGLVNSYNRQGSISSSAFRAWTVNNGNGTGDEAYLFVSIFR